MNKEKIKYNTEQEALDHLKHIVESNHRPWKTTGNKKPIRCYEDGGFWFLTSKPSIFIYKQKN